MSTVGSSTSSSSVTDNLSITKKQPANKNTNELGQAAFLELMITQMNNQNPLSPQDNSEFVAQLAPKKVVAFQRILFELSDLFHKKLHRMLDCLR